MSNQPVWEAHEPPVRPRLEAGRTCDAVVVGLGASGLAAVAHLAERGCEVIGIDAGRIGGGAAGRNGGFLLGGLALYHHDAVAQLGRDRAYALYRSTVDEIEALAVRFPGIVRRTGSLRLAASAEEERDCEAHLEALRADGLAAQAYDGPEGLGLLVTDDASIDPLERCLRTATDLEGSGIELFERSPVQAVDSGRVGLGGGGVISCRAVVVAVDGDLEVVVPGLAGRVRTTRLQMLATSPAPDVDVPRPVYSRWGYDYWQQLPDGRVALGGGRDRFAADEWDAPAEPSTEVQSYLDGVLRDTVGTEAPVTHRWAGRVAYTEDRLPVVELVRPGLTVAGAYAGHGNVIGPLAARAAADAALDGWSLSPWWRPGWA